MQAKNKKENKHMFFDGKRRCSNCRVVKGLEHFQSNSNIDIYTTACLSCLTSTVDARRQNPIFIEIRKAYEEYKEEIGCHACGVKKDCMVIRPPLHMGRQYSHPWSLGHCQKWASRTDVEEDRRVEVYVAALQTCSVMCKYHYILSSTTKSFDELKGVSRIVADEIVKRGECVTCGIVADENTYAGFEFDHRVPMEKKIDVSKCRNAAEVYEEMPKCDLKCANCHSIYTKEQQRNQYQWRREFVQEGGDVDRFHSES